MDVHLHPHHGARAACAACRACRSSAVPSGLSHTLVLIAAMLAWAAGALGCRATINPPADPDRPAAIYLIDYGRTSAVALPCDADAKAGAPTSGRLVRYVYGDWKWYALRQTGSWPGVRALAWPSEGALGRGELAAPPQGDPEALRRELNAQQVFELIVPGDKARRLRDRLDAFHAELGAAGPRQEALGLEFVGHPRRYSLWRNSNHQSAEWLEELDCRVRGPTILSRWRVQKPGSAPPAAPPRAPS